MDLDCLISEVSKDQVSRPDHGGDLSSSSNKLNAECCPLIYREQEEEIPRLDSDSDDEAKTNRGRRLLPLRYASHSSRDSSPASGGGGDAHQSTTRRTKRISPQPTAVRLSSVLVKPSHNRDDLTDDQDSKKRKEELMQSQRSNRQVFDRNKRMFGMLMGTLKKFKTEETSREEVTLKRTKIDEKLLANSKELPITISRTPDGDSAERSEIIDKAELKLDIMGRFKNWESSHKYLAGFIQTETKPKLFWTPKEHNPATEKLLKSSRDYFNLFMAERAAKCKKEIDDLEKAPLRSFIEIDQSRSGEFSASRSPDDDRRHHRQPLPTRDDNRSPASDTSSGSFRR